MKLNTIEEKVTSILEDIAETRDSNSLLYYHYIRRYNRVLLSLPLYKYLLNGADWEFPSYESVTRIRRKVQKKRPDLRPVKTVEAFRDNLEHEFREYARA